jgi:serine/threonine protein kinase
VRKGSEKSSLIQPGEDLNDDYRVGELLAVEGGMGLIYAVSHKRLRELQLVLKVLPSDSPPDMVARMEREAYALSKLSTSRYVVRIQDSGHCRDGMPYIVMDRLSGPHLGKLLQHEGRLDIQRAVGLGMQASLGLHSCHVEGISHRDIKPANLMLHRDAQAHEVVKLIDFGISHVLVGPAITALDKRSGTRRYMPPEQALGNDDERADQFSLAAVIFETLAGPGQLPWPAPKRNDGAAHERFVAAGNYRRLRDLREDAPEDLDEIIRKALSPSPDDRFASMHAFARELVRFADAGSKILFDQYIVTDKSPLVKAASLLTAAGAMALRTASAHRADAPAHDDSDYATVPAKTSKSGRGISRYAGGLAVLGLIGLGGAWMLRGRESIVPPPVLFPEQGAKKSVGTQKSEATSTEEPQPGPNENGEKLRKGSQATISLPDAGDRIGEASAVPVAAPSNRGALPARQRARVKKNIPSVTKAGTVGRMKAPPYSTKGTAIVE